MPVSINNTTLTFNNGTTMTTAATGTVSSVATGNGLSGGTITTSGTLVIACPGYNTVGSYSGPAEAYAGGGVTPFNTGSNYPAGNNPGQIAVASGSGTWKVMSHSVTPSGFGSMSVGLVCKVS